MSPGPDVHQQIGASDEDILSLNTLKAPHIDTLSRDKGRLRLVCRNTCGSLVTVIPASLRGIAGKCAD